MASFITIADILFTEGLFHIINADTHHGVGEAFATGTAAESFLVDQGFTYDPATDNYTRS
tara:strand:+ start:2653 stop:2832 length:180 start_codon:yes stop_codon:yes gene_type:complete